MSTNLPDPIESTDRNDRRSPGTLLASLRLGMRGPQWKRRRKNKPHRSAVSRLLARMRRAA